jgi:hypothetical protein
MALIDAFPGISGMADSVDIRKNMAGLVVRSASGVPRGGVFPRHTDSLLSSRGDLYVDVAPFEGVSVRGGGVLFQAQDGVVQAGPFPAPTANSRIDVVYFKQNESAAPFADASNLPIIGVKAGDPAAVPVKPSIAGIAGAEEIGTVLMLAGKTATNQAGVVITGTHRFTATAGGVVLCRNTGERDSGFGWAAGQTVHLIDSDTLSTLNVARTGWFDRVLNPAPQVPTAYTPAWTASGAAPSLGDSVIAGEYMTQGKRITANIFLQIGSAGVGGGSGSWRFSLPFTGSGNNFGLAHGHLLTATNRQPVTALVQPGTNYVTAIWASGGALESIALTAGNSLLLQVTYDLP